jgi:Crp-like helix-turn-helix domain
MPASARIFMNCTPEERVTLTLLELCENFGVKEKRGTRLTITVRHQDLADLVGASRPRVTEFLIKFEHDKLISRDDHRIIVRRDRLKSFLARDSSRTNWTEQMMRCFRRSI